MAFDMCRGRMGHMNFWALSFWGTEFKLTECFAIALLINI